MSVSRAFGSLLRGPTTRVSQQGFAALLAGDVPTFPGSPASSCDGVPSGSSTTCSFPLLRSSTFHTSCIALSPRSTTSTFVPAFSLEACSSSSTLGRASYASMPSPTLRFQEPASSRSSILKAAKSSEHVRRPAKATPISQGVAYMVSRDQLSPERLKTSMAGLATEFMEHAGSYSVTEVAAWCEVCRQLDFSDADAPGMADAVLSALEGRMGELGAEELAGVCWLLAGRTAPLPPTTARALGEVIIDVASELEHADLPHVCAAVAVLGITDAFALVELAAAVTRGLQQSTPKEVVSLARAYGDMGRTFFDDRLFRALADVVVDAVPGQSRGEPSEAGYSVEQLTELAVLYRSLATRHALLQPAAQKLEVAARARGAQLPPA